MKGNEILEQLERQRFRISKNTAYGVIDEYPLMISMFQSNKRVYVVTITVQDAFDKQSAKDIRQKLKENGIRALANGRSITANVALKRGEGAEKILENVSTMARTLQLSAIRPPRVCGFCGQNNPDIYVLRSDKTILYDTAHRDCVSKVKTEAEIKSTENPGSYLTGLLGALLGAIVGAIPAFLGIFFLNIASGWLFMLLPIGTYFGYKLFKGKMNIVAPIVSVVFSLIGLGLLLMAWDVGVSMNYGYSIGDAIAMTIHYTFVEFSLEYWSWLSNNIAIVIVFYIVGLAFSFGIIYRTNKTELKTVNNALDTIIPINGQENTAEPDYSYLQTDSTSIDAQ